VTFKDSALVKDFIPSIKGLEKLRIKNHDAAIHFLWPAIIQHRDSLHLLMVHMIPDHRFRRDHPPYWRQKQLEELIDSGIEYLGLDFSVNEISKVRQRFSYLASPKPDLNLERKRHLTKLLYINCHWISERRNQVTLPT
jgi:hypothetical protein